jgi:hypothetical protein
VDQCVNRRIRAQPCVAPNGACVSVRSSAQCVRAPVATCGESFALRCEGTLLLHCSVAPAGFVVADDCGNVPGGTCRVDTGGRAACVRP